MVYITRARTTSNELIRGVAIKSHILNSLIERQRRIILHEHHSFGSRLTCNRCMCLQVGFVRILIPLITGTLLYEVEDTLHVPIEVCLSEFPALHASHNRVELSLFTWLQHIITSPHLHSTILSTKPVGHHGTLIAPLITQNSLHQILALRGVNTIDIIIRGHDSPGFALLDGNLETLQIDFAQGPLRHTGIVAHTIGLLVVGSKVLDTGTHIVLLNASDIGSSSLTCHNRVLRIVLEVTATKGITHDVQCGSQQYIGAILLYLFTNGLTYFFNELCVPCRSKQGSYGEVSAIIRGRVALTCRVDTESGRTISQDNGGNAQ